MPKHIPTEKKKAHVYKVKADPIQFRAEAKDFIEKNWKELSLRRKDLFNSALLRVIDFDENDDHVVIEAVSDVMYKDVTGIRYDSGLLPRDIHELDMFKVLSAYFFVVTADSKLVFIERDCGDWEKALDLPGGFVQDKFNITDLADFAVKRTEEDLSLKEGNIEYAECLGLFDFKEILELMAVYKVKLKITLEELRAVSSVKVYEVPKNYSASTHDEHFDVRLHHPCTHVVECFLKRAV